MQSFNNIYMYLFNYKMCAFLKEKEEDKHLKMSKVSTEMESNIMK